MLHSLIIAGHPRSKQQNIKPTLFAQGGNHLRLFKKDLPREVIPTISPKQEDKDFYVIPILIQFGEFMIQLWKYK